VALNPKERVKRRKNEGRRKEEAASYFQHYGSDPLDRWTIAKGINNGTYLRVV